MAERILVVRADEMEKLIGSRHYLALPREEIDRHYAMLEVTAMDREQAGHDPAYAQLITYTTIHFNFSWLTYLCDNTFDEASPHGILSMGIIGDVRCDGHDVLFLDDNLKEAARRRVDEMVNIQAGYELRLAGLLQPDLSYVDRPLLGLVYVAKLSRPGVEEREQGIGQICFYGSGELLEKQNRFDS